MKRSGIGLVIVAAIMGGGISALQPEEEKAIPPEVRFLAAGIKHGREQITGAQAEVTYYQYTPKAVFDFLGSDPEAPKDLPQEDTEQTETARWYYQEPYLSVMIETPVTLRENPRILLRHTRLVANEKQARVLYEYAELQSERGEWHVYHSGSVVPTESVLSDGIWQDKAHLDPRYHAYYWGEKPLDQVFLENHPALEGEEVIEGSRCLKVAVGLSKDWQYFFWVDVDHNFLMRRGESYRSIGGKLVLAEETQVSHLLESNGVWLPGVIERKVHLWGQKVEASGIKGDPALIGTSVFRTTVSDFTAGTKVPPEVFVLEWPLGTQVSDRITHRDFVVVRVHPDKAPAYESNGPVKEGER